LGKHAVLDFRVVHLLEVGGMKFLQKGTCLAIYKSTYPWRCDLVFIKNMFVLDSISGWSLPNCKSSYIPYYNCNSIHNVLGIVFPFWLTVTYLFAFSCTGLNKRCNSSSCISPVSIMKFPIILPVLQTLCFCVYEVHYYSSG
jgi:hypothetical protein